MRAPRATARMTLPARRTSAGLGDKLDAGERDPAPRMPSLT
jgi:hypothetical protein